MLYHKREVVQDLHKFASQKLQIAVRSTQQCQPSSTMMRNTVTHGVLVETMIATTSSTAMLKVSKNHGTAGHIAGQLARDHGDIKLDFEHFTVDRLK